MNFRSEQIFNSTRSTPVASLTQAKSKAWVLVDKRQGLPIQRVVNDAGLLVNDNAGLEKAADVMRARTTSMPGKIVAVQKQEITSPNPVAQRYTVEGDYLVSDGRGLAIPKGEARPHHYYSSAPLYAASLGKLLELESPVGLIKGAVEEALGLNRITAGGARKGGEDLHHPLEKSECIEVASEILRAPDTGKWVARIRDIGIALNPYQISSIQKLIHPIVTSSSKHIRGNEEFGRYIKEANQEIERDTPIPGTGKTLIENLKELPKELFPSPLKREILEYFKGDQMPIHKMMLFLKNLKQEGESGKFKEVNDDTSSEIVREILTRVEGVYGGAFGHDSRREEVTHGYQINEHAVAQLGEALAILSTGPRAQGSDKWNFHVATVIAKEGPDTITMENETNQEQDREAYWAFKMYGSKKGQSFHEQHAHGTEKPITVPVVPGRG